MVEVMEPSSMSSVYIGLDGVIPARIRISNFRIPDDGDVCVLFYGKRKCTVGRPLPPGAVLFGGPAAVTQLHADP